MEEMEEDKGEEEKLLAGEGDANVEVIVISTDTEEEIEGNQEES